MKLERTRWPGIYRRGEKWVAVVGYTNGVTRKQKWLTANTLKDAQRSRRQVLDAASRAARPQDATMPLSELRDAWLKDLGDTKHRPGTIERYRRAVDLYIIPTLGEVAAGLVHRENLTALERANPHAFAVASAMFGWAVKVKGWLDANPCSSVSRTRRDAVEARHLDKGEARRLLNIVAGERVEPAVVLGLMGGLRIGEVCGARWGDLQERTLYIRRQHGDAPLKNGKPRSLVLPAEAVERLRRCRARQAEELLGVGIAQTDATPIMHNISGGHLSHHRVRTLFNELVRRHGFDIPFHGLRHTAAVGMLSSGVDVRTAAARIGDTPAVLLRTYSHFVPSADEDAAIRVATWFGG